MPLNLTKRELARFTGQTAKTTPKKKSVPSVPSERQQIGAAQGEVTHRLVKSLSRKFGNAPVIGSLALCEYLPCGVWYVCVYLECGTARFEMKAEEFGDYFREETGE